MSFSMSLLRPRETARFVTFKSLGHSHANTVSIIPFDGYNNLNTLHGLERSHKGINQASGVQKGEIQAIGGWLDSKNKYDAD